MTFQDHAAKCPRCSKTPLQATLIFFDYERALLSGDHRKAERLARQLRAAGFFVRRLPPKGGRQ